MAQKNTKTDLPLLFRFREYTIEELDSGLAPAKRNRSAKKGGGGGETLSKYVQYHTHACLYLNSTSSHSCFWHGIVFGVAATVEVGLLVVSV